MLELVLILNALWFFGGFHTFYIRRHVFGKIIVEKDQRDNQAFQALVESGRFMGGFNFAFMVLSILVLLNMDAFDKDVQWVVILFSIAVAHASQFFGNVPIALQNRKGEGVWEVFKGLMLFIFVVDFTLMMANGILAFTFYL